MIAVVFDDQPCPKRGNGLAHVGIPVCVECGEECLPAEAREPSREKLPVAPPVPPNAYRKVPLCYMAEYRRFRSEGFTDRDAQSLIALHHGLVTTDGQKEPWDLATLAQLEFARTWTRE